ncbi:hypothetical protein [Hyphomonas jannaschiana]|uniref:hypothetical protein n=1 Tax=Hyphomonas jannaschiana TaxID=86 RepID=UPI0035C6FD75
MAAVCPGVVGGAEAQLAIDRRQIAPRGVFQNRFTDCAVIASPTNLRSFLRLSGTIMESRINRQTRINHIISWGRRHAAFRAVCAVARKKARFGAEAGFLRSVSESNQVRFSFSSLCFMLSILSISA